jgi:large subunit ribosomal protein L1
MEEGPYRNLDETVEFAVNLNVDPRKPGQMLRESVALPHGSGKRRDCIVFTTDPDLEKQALAAGAKYAGGAELIDLIVRGSIPLDMLHRALATPNMVSYLGKAARILGPRGLMPNAKVGTLLAEHSIMDALRTEMAGQQVQYRTEKEGIIQLGIGRGSFTVSQLMDNVRAIMQELLEMKPESHGKSQKKKSSGGGKAPPKRGTTTAKKYFLRSHVTSTFGISHRVDVRTIDPSNMYFMKPLPTDYQHNVMVDGDDDDNNNDDGDEDRRDGNEEEKEKEESKDQNIVEIDNDKSGNNIEMMA